MLHHFLRLGHITQRVEVTHHKVGTESQFLGGSITTVCGDDKVSRSGEDDSILPVICANDIADALHLT